MLMKYLKHILTGFPNSISHVDKLAITAANGLSIKVDISCVKSASFYVNFVPFCLHLYLYPGATSAKPGSFHVSDGYM